MTVAPVFDVTAATFEQEVMERSRTTPVLLDFWADWCDPCKTLGPILERLADEFGGSFLLGRIDSERQPDLAAAFQVQGIPYCVLIDGGRPIDGFQGALSESQVRQFLQRHGIGPAAGAAAPEPAAVEVDPDSPGARLDRALAAARSGAVAQARTELVDFPDDDQRFDRARRLGHTLMFLEAPLDDGAAGAEGLLAGARQRLLAGDSDAAMGQILEAVMADKGFRDGLPRQAMLLCFLLVGEEDERLDSYRRRLATLLY